MQGHTPWAGKRTTRAKNHLAEAARRIFTEAGVPAMAGGASGGEDNAPACWKDAVSADSSIGVAGVAGEVTCVSAPNVTEGSGDIIGTVSAARGALGAWTGEEAGVRRAERRSADDGVAIGTARAGCCRLLGVFRMPFLAALRGVAVGSDEGMADGVGGT